MIKHKKLQKLGNVQIKNENSGKCMIKCLKIKKNYELQVLKNGLENYDLIKQILINV
jgi:hypothetical protein